MAKFRFTYLLLFFIGLAHVVYSGNLIENTKYEVKLMSSNSTGDKTAFWLQNNRNGTVSFQPHSGSLSAGLFKNVDTKNRLFDYGFKIDTHFRLAEKTALYFPELYLNARLSVFELKAGRRIEHYGNQDSILSSGGLLFSQNAMPIPSITAGIPQFTYVPFTFNFVEIKGALSHGYFTDNIMVEKMRLHHKFGYVRLGGSLPVKLQYGIHHVAQWGGIVPELGQQPVGLKNYFNIFTARSGGSDALQTDQINTLGNHIISQNLKLELNFSDIQLDAYWQNISEDGPVRFIASSVNRSDGLWGLALKSNKFPVVKRILYEYLNTTDQSGPYHDKDGIVYGGNDSYFNNGVYQSGWTYFSRTIGTPLITSPIYTGYPFITNNRVQAHHFGINGEIENVSYKFLSTFSKNYRQYSLPIDPMRKNASYMLEMSRQFPAFHNIEGSVSLAVDHGEMYGNNFGLMIQLVKRGNFFK